MIKRALLSMAVTAALASGTAHAATTQLISNGGFETGDFTGWVVTNHAASFAGSNWFVTGGVVTPVSGFATVGPSSGSFYAVTDQSGAGTHILEQSFTVPAGATSVILQFDMFINDQSGVGPLGTLLDHTAGAAQHARVDIMTALAGAFSTAAVDIVLNVVPPSVDAGPNPHPYTTYVADLTAFVAPGSTYKLRFGEVDNQLFFHQGVDNVSIVARSNDVPEPATLALLGLGLLGAAAGRRRAR